MQDHQTEESRPNRLSPPADETPLQPPLLAPPIYIDTTRSAEPLRVTRIFQDKLTQNDPKHELFEDRDGTKKTKNGEKEVKKSIASVVEEENAPDGGWGWCTVMASFFINLIEGGILYSRGVYFPVFLDQFEESASKTAWIGSLCIGCSYIISPLAGAATNRYGCKKVSIFGCFWASLSLLAASFVNSVDLLIIVWGISTGCAFGFLQLPGFVIVGLWFDKKRGIATGIIVTGTAVGLLVLPPFCTSLIENFGWRVSVYALSGLVFLCAPLALLYRDVPVKSGHRCSNQEKEGKTTSQVLEKQVSSCAEQSVGPTVDNYENGSCESRNGSLPKTSVKMVEDEGQNVSNGDLGVPTNELRRLALKNLKQSYCNSMWTVNPNANNVNTNRAYVKVVNGKSLDDLRENRTDVPVRRSLSFNPRPNMPDILENPAQQNLAFLREPPSAGTVNLAQSPVEGHNQLSISRRDNAREEAGTEVAVLDAVNTGALLQKRFHCNRFLRGILQMLRVEVLKDPCFILHLITSVFVFFGFFTPFTYIADYAIREGVDLSGAAFIISITGIANTIGRPIFGVLEAMKWLDSVVTFHSSAIVYGLLTIAAPFLKNYWMIALYALLFGLCVAGHMCTRPLAVAQLMGVKNLPSCLGYTLMAQGVATMCGAPLTGLLYDKETGSYTACFILAGVVMIVGGLLGLPLRRLSERQRMRYPERYIMQA